MSDFKLALSTSFFIGMFLSWAPVNAVMLSPSSAEVERALPSKMDKNANSISNMREGIIRALDVASNTIVIGTTSYLFFPGLVKVQSSNPLINGNPLRLQIGHHVKFFIVAESSGKFRVSDVIVKN